MELTDRRVVVVGASSGIGEAVEVQAADAGARGRRRPQAGSAAGGCRAVRPRGTSQAPELSSAAKDVPTVLVMRNRSVRRDGPAQELRARATLRRAFGEPAQYMLEGSRGQRWRKCRIVDISREGAGVELFDTTTEEATAHRVVLELEIAPAVLRLRGDVRHARPGVNGGVHVGLHFTSLAALEQDLLDSLVGPESPAH